eukprot:3598292-Amphidinium_carterae.1
MPQLCYGKRQILNLKIGMLIEWIDNLRQRMQTTIKGISDKSCKTYHVCFLSFGTHGKLSLKVERLRTVFLHAGSHELRQCCLLPQAPVGILVSSKQVHPPSDAAPMQLDAY